MPFLVRFWWWFTQRDRPLRRGMGIDRGVDTTGGVEEEA
jgi:hypothetical protein